MATHWVTSSKVLPQPLQMLSPWLVEQMAMQGLSGLELACIACALKFCLKSLEKTFLAVVCTDEPVYSLGVDEGLAQKLCALFHLQLCCLREFVSILLEDAFDFRCDVIDRILPVVKVSSAHESHLLAMQLLDEFECLLGDVPRLQDA